MFSMKVAVDEFLLLESEIKSLENDLNHVRAKTESAKQKRIDSINNWLYVKRSDLGRVRFEIMEERTVFLTSMKEFKTLEKLHGTDFPNLEVFVSDDADPVSRLRLTDAINDLMVVHGEADNGEAD